MRPEWMYGQNLTKPAASSVASAKQNKTGPAHSMQINQSFADLLNTKLQNESKNSVSKQNIQTLQFSKHAVERLRARSIQISTEQMKRIEQGIDQIAQKGGKDSLIICGNVSLVVNVPNRTVVTAMNTNGSDNHVFTQIDSAVIV